ncbi:MAG: hypothetical protein ACTSX6_06870 [Candidatus Heimdallarchaeaceae archaeon]
MAPKSVKIFIILLFVIAGTVGLAYRHYKLTEEREYQEYLDSDPDNDGATVREENEHKTDNSLIDTDFDGRPDGDEIHGINGPKTNATNPSTDGDPLLDGEDPNPLDDVENQLFEFVESHLPEEIGSQYIDVALGDGKFNQRDLDNIKFLKNIYETNRTKFNQLVENGQVFSYDIDKDGKSNYLESFKENSDFSKENPICYILFDTFPYTENGYDDAHIAPYINIINGNPNVFNEIRYMLKVNRVSEDRVIGLLGEDATVENLVSSLNKMNNLAYGNSTLFLELTAHGPEDSSSFKCHDQYLKYDEISEIIDNNVNPNKFNKVVVTVTSCNSDNAREPMKTGEIERVFITDGHVVDILNTYGGLYWKEFTDEIIPDVDSNHDGYLSLDEIFEYKDGKVNDMTIDDENNIAKTIFLGDATVGEYLEPLETE